jgi:hypothetical protein
MTTTDESARLYERFQLIVNGPALFNAVVTGLELGIFSFLSDHPGATAEEIRRYVDIPAHKLRILLLGLCSTELVDRRDGGYVNSSVAEELLATDDADSWRHILLGWKKIYYPAFAEMTTALRTGTNTALDSYPGSEATLYQRLVHQPELEATLHASMAAFTLASMPGLTENAEISSVRHLLDIGGGDGTTAVRFAQKYPGAQVTIFDLPTVTLLAERRLPDSVADRISLHPGDLFQDPFPQVADGILFSHVLEVFSADQICALLAKAFDALPVGGKAFIYGFNAAADERSGVLAARLSLYLNVLATGDGMAYPAKDYEGWMTKVGFASVKSFTDLPYEHGLVVGTKE